MDKDPYFVALTLKSFLKEASHPPELVSNAALQSLFKESTTVAFAAWQHLAAVERLSHLVQWQTDHAELWLSLSSGTKLCGLATTHLGRPDGASIVAAQVETGYLLNGHAAWVCGYKIFDFLLVGFETESEINFAIIDFPNDIIPKAIIGISVSPVKMVCLEGTSTVQIDFKNMFVSSGALISTRIKSSPAAPPRVSRYIIPELGIGERAMEEIQNIIARSNHPKTKSLATALGNLRLRFDDITKLRKENTSTEILIPLRDDFNRDAVRIFSLAAGSAAFLSGSLVSRLYLELILLDSVLQAPKIIEEKILSTSKRK